MTPDLCCVGLERTLGLGGCGEALCAVCYSISCTEQNTSGLKCLLSSDVYLNRNPNLALEQCVYEDFYNFLNNVFGRFSKKIEGFEGNVSSPKKCIFRSF